MIATRSALFGVSLLGVVYALLSIVNGSEMDTAVGMLVTLAGIVGWGTCDWIEERQ